MTIEQIIFLFGGLSVGVILGNLLIMLSDYGIIRRVFSSDEKLIEPYVLGLWENKRSQTCDTIPILGEVDSTDMMSLKQGYQPFRSDLDPDNPPQGGSGVLPRAPIPSTSTDPGLLFKSLDFSEGIPPIQDLKRKRMDDE